MLYLCRFVARLIVHPSQSRGVLSVLETSRLRHLKHLELEFRAASDLDLKDYLSQQVKLYKVFHIFFQKTAARLLNLAIRIWPVNSGLILKALETKLRNVKMNCMFCGRSMTNF